ncbi:Alpha/Beta hydrolase protein [Podospora aff. communis PSN243]|uniref:Alpha/Beta hydrolase protein n=1 Tax=Podospora aff. communis PSN243 TaxID=3040156 RepID=A0AAV9G4V6_9PEZI|nr:Alpha/Beta hydrolase protein [Podospora aff. communis PSN243]
MSSPPPQPTNNNNPAGTILFIEGAWRTFTAYTPFFDAVRARGYDLITPQLPTNTPRRTTLADPPAADIAHFAAAARALADSGRDFTCVMHSYGGAIGTEAMHGLGVSHRRALGLPGGVTRLIYITAFMVEVGKSLEDTAPAEQIGWMGYEGELKVFLPGYDIAGMWYNDLPPEERQRQLAQTVPHPKAGSFRRPEVVAYEDIPSTFVYCTLDNAFPYAVQQALVAAHKSKGVHVDEETVEAGHYPFLSVPEKLADVVLKWC